jgi:hypothetical protein
VVRDCSVSKPDKPGSAFSAEPLTVPPLVPVTYVVEDLWLKMAGRRE